MSASGFVFVKTTRLERKLCGSENNEKGEETLVTMASVLHSTEGRSSVVKGEGGRDGVTEQLQGQPV